MEHADGLALAFKEARRSPDPRTKCGAVLIGPSPYHQIFYGHNRPAASRLSKYMAAVDGSKIDGLDKYDVMIHAEENAIHTARAWVRDLSEWTLYCTHYPCSRKCAPLITFSGIRTVVTCNPCREVHRCDVSETLFNVCGVTIITLPDPATKP